MKMFYNNDIVDNIETHILNFEYDKALSIAQDYVKNYPKDRLGPIYLARCKVLNNDDDIENVIKECETILNSKLHNNSSYVIGYTWYGSMLNDLGLIEDAIDKYKKAISYEKDGLDQISLKARLRLSNIYIESKQIDKAMNLLKNINTNNNAVILNKLAYAYITNKNYNKAYEILKDIDDNYFKDELAKQKFFINKGIVYHEKKLDNKAITYLKKVLTIKNTYYNQAIKYLSNILYSLNQYDEAIKYGLILLETKIFAFDANVILGKTYLKKGMIDEAFYYINNLTDEKIKNYYLNLINYILGDFNKTITIGEHLLNFSEEDKTITILTEVIYAYIRLNKIDEAYYIFKNVKQDLDKPVIEQLTAYFYKYYNKELEENLTFYSAKQIYNYNIEDAIEHIYDHHYDSNKNSMFNNKETIKDLMLKSKAEIESLTPRYEYLFNKYIYSNNNSNKDNKLVVVTIPNTNNIITMYNLEGDTIYGIDDVKKIKRESQIDKFYKKYGKK